MRKLGIYAVPVSLALIFALLFGGPVAWGTCGGGGGGGNMGAYATAWTALAQALQKAPEAKSGILLYFSPQGQTTDHSLFRTKMLADLSQEHPCVKVEFDKEDPLRKEMSIPPGATIVISDWHGNAIKKYTLRKFTERFRWKEIEGALLGMPSIVKKLEKKLDSKLTRGEKDLARERYRAALKSLRQVAEFKGYEAVEPAKELIEKALSTGEQKVKEATELAASDRKAGVKALKKLTREFKGTSVEEAAREALETLGEKGAPSDRSPSPLEEDGVAKAPGALEEMVAEIDEVIAGLVAGISDLPEKVTERVLKGLGAELQGRYKVALWEYEAAVALDPTDSVAHRFLGEFCRHHSGDWDRAKSEFQEVIRLGNDPYSVAIALHGLGKMTIAGGDNKAGLALIEKSVEVRPTPLAYRNLAVFWNSEGEFAKADGYLSKAVALEPDDAYNRVFAAVYLARDGQRAKALAVVEEVALHPSMHYNLACIYSELGERNKALTHLRKHFYEFEQYDAVRRHEMAEARSDINFRKIKDDPTFLEITSLAEDRATMGSGDSGS